MATQTITTEAPKILILRFEPRLEDVMKRIESSNLFTKAVKEECALWYQSFRKTSNAEAKWEKLCFLRKAYICPLPNSLEKKLLEEDLLKIMQEYVPQGVVLADEIALYDEAYDLDEAREKIAKTAITILQAKAAQTDAKRVAQYTDFLQKLEAVRESLESTSLSFNQRMEAVRTITQETLTKMQSLAQASATVVSKGSEAVAEAKKQHEKVKKWTL